MVEVEENISKSPQDLRNYRYTATKTMDANLLIVVATPPVIQVLCLVSLSGRTQGSSFFRGGVMCSN